MEKVKTIVYRLTLKGSGVVNFDGSLSRYTINSHSDSFNEIYSNNNVSIAKCAYYKTGKLNALGNEIYERCLKISGNCLRQNMFRKDYDVSNGRLNRSDKIMANYYASPAGMLKGYLNTENNLKSKSAISLSSAIDKSGAVIFPEVGSKSGDKSDTSLYFTENVGEVIYVAKGSISLKQLEFDSCDDFYERRAIKNEWVEGKDRLFEIACIQHYGHIPYKIGTYTSAAKTLTKHVGEYGLHFDESFRKIMVKEAFKRMLDIHIKHNVSLAYVKGLEIKPIYDDDPIGLAFEDENGWINVQNNADIDNVIDPLSFDDFYEEVDNDVDAVKDELYAKEKAAKEEKNNQGKNNGSKSGSASKDGVNTK